MSGTETKNIRADVIVIWENWLMHLRGQLEQSILQRTEITRRIDSLQQQINTLEECSKQPEER